MVNVEVRASTHVTVPIASPLHHKVPTPRESHGQRSLDKEGFPQTLRILTQEKKRLLINGKGPKLRIITTSLWNRGKGQTC